MSEADGSDMGLEEVLTSVKKVPKSSRKRQNSQSGGRKGAQPRANESLRDDSFDMLHTGWLDEKVNGDDDLRRSVDKKPPKSRKKSESKVAAGDGKASRRSRADSDMARFGFALDDVRANGGMAVPSLDAKQRRRGDARSSSFEQAWNPDLFAGRPDFRMDPLLSASGAVGGFGARFDAEPGTSVDARKSLAAALDKQVGGEKGSGRARQRRRSDVKTDAAKLSPDVAAVDRPEALLANTLDTGNANAATANLPNHKVCWSAGTPIAL